MTNDEALNFAKRYILAHFVDKDQWNHHRQDIIDDLDNWTLDPGIADAILDFHDRMSKEFSQSNVQDIFTYKDIALYIENWFAAKGVTRGAWDAKTPMWPSAEKIHNA